MLKPEQMSRLLIAASRDQMVPVITELYRHHLLHIEGFKIGSPLSGASETSADLIKIRSIASAIAVRDDDIEPQKTCTRADLKTRIERELPGLEREVEDLTVRRSKLDTRVKELEQKIAEIRPLVSSLSLSLPANGLKLSVHCRKQHSSQSQSLRNSALPRHELTIMTGKSPPSPGKLPALIRNLILSSKNIHNSLWHVRSF